MYKFMMATALLVLAGTSAGYARGGMHSGGMHSAGMGALMTPASPSVPPSLTPDSRLTGSAPLPPHPQPTRNSVASLPDTPLTLDPEDAKVDKMISGICRGC
jgi:hypothetical protein